jgi:hypothetical protein
MVLAAQVVLSRKCRSWLFLYVVSVVGYPSRPDQEARYMDVPAFVASIAANFLTVTVLYGLWRLTKNERDMKAMGICLASFSFIALAALASLS